MDRFWAKTMPVTESGCLLWTASTMSNGYGAFNIDGMMHGAHRIAWELINGEIPDGMFVCHKCDVKTCVNPDHLFLGTHEDNMRDMEQKGRKPKGEKCSFAKLTNQQVEKLRNEYVAGGITQYQLAEKYNIGQAQVNRIIKYKRRQNG